MVISSLPQIGLSSTNRASHMEHGDQEAGRAEQGMSVEIRVGVKYHAVRDTSGLDSYFPSANIYSQELLGEEGEPQGITMDRCPDQDRLLVA